MKIRMLLLVVFIAVMGTVSLVPLAVGGDPIKEELLKKIDSLQSPFNQAQKEKGEANVLREKALHDLMEAQQKYEGADRTIQNLNLQANPIVKQIQDIEAKEAKEKAEKEKSSPDKKGK